MNKLHIDAITHKRRFNENGWIRSTLSKLFFPALYLAFSGAVFAQEVVVEMDSLLCEGGWVTMTASAEGCSVNSVSWQETQDDGSLTDVDGSKDHYELDGGNTLGTQLEKSYTATLSCDDGRVLTGEGQVEQQTDDSKC